MKHQQFSQNKTHVLHQKIKGRPPVGKSTYQSIKWVDPGGVTGETDIMGIKNWYGFDLRPEPTRRITSPLHPKTLSQHYAIWRSNVRAFLPSN